MAYCRRVGDGQRFSDLAIAAALRDQGRDLLFAVREGTRTRAKRGVRGGRLVADQWTARDRRARTHNTESMHRLEKTFEDQRPEWVDFELFPRRGMHSLADDDLTVVRLVAQTPSKIDDAADRSVVRPPRETDRTQGGIAHIDSHLEAQLVTNHPPANEQLSHPLAHCACEAERLAGRVGDWQRVVEKHRESTAGEMAQRPFEREAQVSNRGVILTQDVHHCFRLRGFLKGAETLQLAAQHRDLAPVALQQ